MNEVCLFELHGLRLLGIFALTMATALIVHFARKHQTSTAQYSELTWEWAKQNSCF